MAQLLIQGCMSACNMSHVAGICSLNTYTELCGHVHDKSMPTQRPSPQLSASRRFTAAAVLPNAHTPACVHGGRRASAPLQLPLPPVLQIVYSTTSRYSFAPAPYSSVKRLLTTAHLNLTSIHTCSKLSRHITLSQAA